MTIYNFSFPTRILFGAGASKELPIILKDQKLKKPFLLTDSAVATLPFFAELKASISSVSNNLTVFSDLQGNPVRSQVTAGVQAYKKQNCDSLIVVGGGAALDVAKAVALMINHPGDLFDYEDGKPDARPVNQPIPYIIALPTTAGTGSEVGRSSVISDDQTKAKKIIFSPALLAKVVLADPELTLGLPPRVTAATGMDALTHCVESYLAKGFHPLCDGIALEGIRLIHRSLVTAVKSPSNLEARSNMLMASMMGAVAFQKGLGVTHSCAHALSTVFDLHHGLANSLMIGPCMRFNASAAADRFAIMAEVVQIRQKTADAFVQWLEHLREECGLPLTLKDAEVKATDRVYQVAINDVCHQSNPRPVTLPDIKQIFADA